MVGADGLNGVVEQKRIFCRREGQINGVDSCPGSEAKCEAVLRKRVEKLSDVG